MGAFDEIVRSIELHGSIRFQAQREFSSEFEDVALLIAANLVLLVIQLFQKTLSVSPQVHAPRPQGSMDSKRAQ